MQDNQIINWEDTFNKALSIGRDIGYVEASIKNVVEALQEVIQSEIESEKVSELLEECIKNLEYAFKVLEETL